MNQTIEAPLTAAGSRPEPLSTRIFVRCYRHYGDAKRAYDQLRVVAGIPDKRMTVVARGLEWRETLPTGRLYKVACVSAAAIGAAVGLLLWAVGLTSAGTEALTAMILGTLSGLVLGFVVATAIARLRARRNGIADTGHVEPRQYDILVEEDLAPAAREVLATD
jgi:hypothetical protein